MTTELFELVKGLESPEDLALFLRSLDTPEHRLEQSALKLTLENLVQKREE